MTVKELIDKISEEKPHSFPDSKIIGFINEVEPEVAEQLNVSPAPVYDENSGTEELLAESPYDCLYVSYVKAKIDYAHEEYASYQLNEEQHTQDFMDFCNWVVRTSQAAAETGPKLRFIHTF